LSNVSGKALEIETRPRGFFEKGRSKVNFKYPPILRKIMKRKCLIIFLALFLILVAGCGEVHDSSNRTVDSIRIASFNIQIFGQSKINKPEVMDVLSKIIKKFDIVAIQEVRSKEQNVIPALLNLVNDADTRYDYVISERLGRTGSKEQYAFVYNPETVDLVPESSYVVEDPDDVFEREPFVAFFRGGNFDFKVINNHIKPGDVEAELSRLAAVINDIYDSSSEKDVIVLGDMNADGSYFNEDDLTTILPLWIQLIGNDEDTTVAASDNTYDRMMTRDTTASVEYTGKSGVFRWDVEYGVTDTDFIKRVSDHYPVYAEFRTDLPDDD